jgi:hypothetical protein
VIRAGPAERDEMAAGLQDTESLDRPPLMPFLKVAHPALHLAISLGLRLPRFARKHQAHRSGHPPGRVPFLPHELQAVRRTYGSQTTASMLLSDIFAISATQSPWITFQFCDTGLTPSRWTLRALRPSGRRNPPAPPATSRRALYSLLFELDDVPAGEIPDLDLNSVAESGQSAHGASLSTWPASRSAIPCAARSARLIRHSSLVWQERQRIATFSCRLSRRMPLRWCLLSFSAVPQCSHRDESSSG